MSEQTLDATAVEARIAALEERLAEAERVGARARDRGAVENLFSTYMYLHNAFRDEEIIPLWVKPGTPGIRAQYSNIGVYTTWESVTAYHRDRPTPTGKLILHYTFFTPGEVDGKRVWAHWVWAKYELDFLRQDGEWRIWHFRCYETARAPFHENWISFAARDVEGFDKDLMYFGEDGRPKFMPPPDEPATDPAYRYSPDRSERLQPRPPAPFTTFAEIAGEGAR